MDEPKPARPVKAPTDPFWDIRETVHWDDQLGVVVERTQFFPGLVDAVKHLHNTGQQGSADWRPLMHIPGVLIEDWCQKQGASFDEFTRDVAMRRRFLNDPDLAAFRVWKGRV